MADYQVRARVPQETADKLFNFIKEEQERTPAGDVTASSVVRAALEDYMNVKDYVKLSLKRLNSKQVKEIMDIVGNLEKKSEDNEIQRFFLVLALELFPHMDRKQREENPELYKFMEDEGLDKMTLAEIKALNKADEERFNK